MKVGIVGLGYVGIPLLINLIKKNIRVIGFDINKQRIESLKNLYSEINYINLKIIKKKVNTFCEFYSSFEKIKEVDIIILCLPTPLKKNNPDLSFIKTALKLILPYLRKNQILSLESTTYPGTSREIILPSLSKKFRVGKNFHLIYSPERVDPGNKNFKLNEIPKVVGGYSKKCLIKGYNFYKIAFKEVIKVSSLEVAEFSKIFENTFRSVNLGLVNELKIFSNKLDINFNEVVKAASTKPFGFMPFYPGPGVGGHCIPIDPLYLSWLAKKNKTKTQFIDLANKINKFNTKNVSKKVIDFCKKNIPNKEKLLLIGVTYKKDIDDLRESPAIKIIKDLLKNNVKFDYFDPYVKEISIPFKKKEIKLNSIINLNKLSNNYAILLICTDHSCINFDLLYRKSKIIFDTRNVYNYHEKNVIHL